MDIGREKAELQTLLSSKVLAPAPSLSKLLSFICDKYFEGEADKIKEYTLAVEVFGRSADFRSRGDSIVRVEVNRLRKKLKTFYRTEGKNHPVWLVIPPGQYVPQFEYRRSRDSQAGGAGGPFFRASSSSLAPLPDYRAPEGHEIRIMPGSSLERNVDRTGKVWLGDCNFDGGEVFAASHTANLRSEDSPLCRQAREGDFKYHVPLPPGIYELHLYFAEMLYGFEPEGGGETSRIFHVLANGSSILREFDILSDAQGSGKLDERVFIDLSPASDGCLHLEFISHKGKATVNGLEILPGIPGRMRPVRITTRNASYISADQQLWEPDRYYHGGRSTARLHPVEGTKDSELYQNERYGHFSYVVPAAPGRYIAVLRFAETYFGPNNAAGGGIDSRLFDVFCNGQTLIKDLDIFKEAGGANRALEKAFAGLRANAQGKLIFQFVPAKNYACVNAIEILPE